MFQVPACQSRVPIDTCVFRYCTIVFGFCPEPFTASGMFLAFTHQSNASVTSASNEAGRPNLFCLAR